MLLQRGITWISSRKDDPPIVATTDLHAFRSQCFAMSFTMGARVHAVRERYIPVCNFAIAYIEFSNAAVAALLNVVHPVLAFAQWPVEGQVTFDFVDCPVLARQFGSHGEYLMPTLAELNQPLVRELCGELTAAELKDLRYFRPARVGDVIFNYWD